jgi:arginase family enzyme
MSSSLRYISSNPKTAAVRFQFSTHNITHYSISHFAFAQIVGCPFSGGQPRAGVDVGPIHLVEAGLPKQLEKLGWKVKFDGHHQYEEFQGYDDPPIGIVKNTKTVSAVCERVALTVAAHVKAGELPVTLGGDHSLVKIRGIYNHKDLFLHAAPTV